METIDLMHPGELLYWLATDPSQCIKRRKEMYPSDALDVYLTRHLGEYSIPDTMYEQVEAATSNLKQIPILSQYRTVLERHLRK